MKVLEDKGDGLDGAPDTGLTLTRKIHFSKQPHGRKKIQYGAAPTPSAPIPGRIPRISRLMALAIRFDGLIKAGHVKSYAELARLGQVTRARVTQIMNLLNLAPDIQEEVLFLPRVLQGKDPVTERDLRQLVGVVDWGEQRNLWNQIKLCI